MRLLITADLHYNHGKSRALAAEVIEQMNRAGGDGVLVVGDTATADGDWIEQCLSLFRIKGPKMFVAGNHELWTLGPDSYTLFRETLPRRIRDAGWIWLQDDPFVADGFAIVGSVGWYDYSFAQKSLGIPERFYERKISPGVAEHYFEEFKDLFDRSDDVLPPAREVIARWNDGRYVKLHRSDEEFLDELLEQFRCQLESLQKLPNVIAAVHHLPFRSLLPSSHNIQWDFAKAFLGSEKIGELLLEFGNISHVYCGHSHLAVEAKESALHAINIGCGYRWKTFRTLDLP